MNGVGVATADGLTIIDIDDDAVVERVLAIVPLACTAPACVGQRGRKIFMRAADGKNLRERNLSGVSTGGVLEILAWHRQGVLPPTVHPKMGHPYVWVDENSTLLTTALHCLPVLTDADIEALRAAFAIPKPVVPKKRASRAPRLTPANAAEPGTAYESPARWWEACPNRLDIERLARLFGIVHRAARDRGGQIIFQAEGTDAAGRPHRPEIIDINVTAHWRHVVRVIVDVLGNTPEAYMLHIEVSRGSDRILKRREEIKRRTIEQRRRQHFNAAA